MSTYYPEQLPEKSRFESLPRVAQIRVNLLLHAGRRVEDLPEPIIDRPTPTSLIDFEARRRARIEQEEALVNERLQPTNQEPTIDQLSTRIEQIYEEQANGELAA